MYLLLKQLEESMSMLNGIRWRWSNAFNGKFDRSDTIELIEYRSCYKPLVYDFDLLIRVFAKHKKIEVVLSTEEAEQFGSYLLDAVKKAKERTIEANVKPQIAYTPEKTHAANVEERMHGDVMEHKHPENDYWHPASRPHKI